MFRTLINYKNKRLYLWIGLVWILFWLLPWGKLLSIQGNLFYTFPTDLIRLGIALLLFIVPGALLYLLFVKNDASNTFVKEILPIGFSFSVVLISVLGLIGRFAGLSFEVVKNIFAFIGLFELFLLASLKPNFSVDKLRLADSVRSALRNPPLILAFVFVALMTFHDNLFFIDDTTYQAYITNWQHSEQLGFRNIVHEIDAIEHFRFWLALYPMGQALLADLSGLSGLLLLGNYLEPYLIILAVVTSYWFARFLGLSRKAAGFAVLFQVTLYAWMMGDYFPVGMWFYQSMAEDKVTAAFILAPVFFVFGIKYIQRPLLKNLLLTFLIGIGLSLTHPVILFYSACIVVCMGIFALVEKKFHWRKALQLVVIVGLVMLPYLVIRVFDNGARTVVSYDAVSASETFQIERYTLIVDDFFYGLNPETLKFVDFEIQDGAFNVALQIFRWFPAVIALLAGLIALLNLKKGQLYLYVLACVALIVFATIPYTAWIIGYFVSARLLSRSSWFSPLGIGSVLVLMELRRWLKSAYNSRELKKLSGTALGLVACFVFISPMLLYHFLPRIPAYFEVLDHNKQLSRVGAYIDQNTSGPVMVIALDYWDMQLLPGVSAHARLISFREEMPHNGFNNFLSIEEARARISASDLIRSLDQDTPSEERCTLIEKFSIKYVLAKSEDVDRYTSVIKECKFATVEVFDTKNLSLLEFR